ncbi:MAG: hypothetical protein RBS99_17420, partial [Rhodospirillales bacterium]|nr:hypothetical protein [Rhodospirillales bacterium]
MHAEGTDCVINVAYGDAAPHGLPVSQGVPLPPGVMQCADPLAVVAPGGEVRPAAGRALARWPDGSVRWALVSFGAREAGPHRLVVNPARVPSLPEVRLTQAGNRWVIDTDRLHVVVCETGPGVLGELVCDGEPRLMSPGDFCLSVDGASTRHERKRTVRVIESSPVRVRLRVEGAHVEADGTRRLHYRLGIEVWAGWPAVRFDYHYFHLEPSTPSLTIRRIALDTAWRLGPDTRRHFIQRAYGLFNVSRHVFNPGRVALVADFDRGAPHVEDAAMLLDDVDYPFYLNPPLIDTHEWLGVDDGTHGVYLRIQDFLAARPNRISSEAHRLSAELWPATAQPLDLPQGRSRCQTIFLAFPGRETVGSGTAKLSNAPVQAPRGVASVLNALQHEGRAAVAPGWVAHCRAFKQDHVLPAGAHFRIESNLRNLVQLDMPCTKFDVGDTDSHYNSSYAAINAGKVPPLVGAPSVPRFFPKGRPTQTYLDLHEPVWTNNEYDCIHAVAAELMRTGRSDLWNTLRLTARHAIEVDFLHFSDHRWLHRATPAHSARHTTTGAYPSHFWTQGLLEYYCLSGDPDALEIALALGDKTLENFHDPELRAIHWGFNREIGWAVLLLACLVDLTGETRFRPLLDEMVDYLVGFNRQAFTGGINLSAGNDRQNLNRQIVGNFFGYASMIEGIDLYADLSGRRDVARWLGDFCL